MSDLLFNMSAPPRSRVEVVKKQLNEYICFNPFTLAKCLTNSTSITNLARKVKDYVKKHPKVKAIIEKPTGYMLAEAINIEGINASNKELIEKLKKYDYEECDNLNLLIVVFCSTVGDLYIPNRELSFENSKFNKILMFPKEEVES